RLNEGMAVVFLLLGLCFILSLASYHQQDGSFDTATVDVRPLNLIGKAGSHVADLTLQLLGLASFAIPVLLLALAWKWLRSEPIDSQLVKVAGSVTLILGVCSALSLGPDWRPFAGTVLPGGLLGLLLADYLVSILNPTGAVLLNAACLTLSLYLVSTFSVTKLPIWLAGPISLIGRLLGRLGSWRQARREQAAAKKELRQQKRREAEQIAAQAAAEKQRYTAPDAEYVDAPPPSARRRRAERIEERTPVQQTAPPIEVTAEEEAVTPPWLDDIPIRTLEDWAPQVELDPEPVVVPLASEPEPEPERKIDQKLDPKPVKRRRSVFRIPSTTLLNEPQPRTAYDSQELKDTAARIKAKLEEFNVLGSVVQINPGPVVTTFEFKPEAGIKYSRITALTEDLCLGLHAESILIERIPGKPTVGIEVPNTIRETISLREILESPEFRDSPSPLTMSMGKDISGRIKVAALDSMPHLLIAGSTGSGKSVMLNTMIMSLLYKSTPNDVRMIMIDPKRVELGIYEGIPHLLTPVITEARKATNALRNAVLEMERRLKLLAAQGVRNIDQYNRKIRQMQRVPRSLFADDEPEPEHLQPLPYILILIDELADLMMLERANVEEAVTRLAQMARAVGMHLVLATQRPSVDVITGLIKANFPTRISFRVATRVDSRTILDVMGSEHLLGKGDMLLLPPGSARLTRVHGAYISETEINSVVEFWKEQAEPDYDKTFLMAPPAEDEEETAEEEFDGQEDPMYHDAVRVVLEMGKASTSTLQRRLRLGYGRAARILDMMQREGIIGPPDGSKPREVLKRPDWLQEIDHQLR
ncbi:MAG: DNA translocase FtsK 4TM domain-containing protein, partial [Bryobacteraceae bacterium]